MAEEKSHAKIVKEEAPVAQNNAATVPQQPEGGRPGPDEKKAGEQETLRQQLTKLVSRKLAANNGDLDHAGLLALETLSKMAPEGELESTTTSGTGKRILPPGIEKLPKFSGKDPLVLGDILNRFHSLVVAALPGSSPSTVSKALNRDVVFVLEGSALKFFNSLKAGEIEWEPTPPPPPPPPPVQQDAVSPVEGGEGRAQHKPGKPPFQPPSTWAEVCNALHDHYLPADGIARTSETLFSLCQAAGESVPSLAQRQMGLTHHLSRLIDAHGNQTFWDAIMIRMFERALRADLRRLQHAEPPCPTFQESVDRAERNAINQQKKQGKRRKGASGGGHTDSGTEDGKTQDSSGVGEAKEMVQGWGGGKRPAHVWSMVRAPIAVSGAREDVAGDATAEDFLLENTKGLGRNRGGEGTYDGASHGAGGVLHDDVSRSTSVWQGEPNQGQGHDGGVLDEDRSRVFGKRNRKMKWAQKRVRDWQEEQHASGQHHPFPPHQHWQVDPGAIPPCRLPQCKSINRQFHCSNDCYFHPKNGERNRAKKNRPLNFRHRSSGDPNNGANNNIAHEGPPNQFY